MLCFRITVQKYCFLVRCARLPKGRVCIFLKKIAQSSTLRSLQLVHNSNQLIANNLGSLVHLEHLVNLEHNKKSGSNSAFFIFLRTLFSKKTRLHQFFFSRRVYRCDFQQITKSQKCYCISFLFGSVRNLL